MSLPTLELGNLSIGGSMVSNRERGQRKRRTEERARKAARAAQAAATAGTSTSPVPGHTGLRYDIQRISPSSRIRAIRGLQDVQFTVDRAERKEPTDGVPYYAFQLKVPVSVRIYDQETRRPETSVTCTCDQFESRPCVHIFWLFDSLNYALSDRNNTNTNTIAEVVTNENVLEKISALYKDLKDHVDDGSFILKLNETRIEEVSDDSDDDFSDSGLQHGDREDTERIAQDMLSIFKDDKLPGEFELETDPTDLVDDDNLFKTIYGLALHDIEFRFALRRVLNEDFCAHHAFEKIKDRIEGALERFDENTKPGQRSDPEIVQKVADRLRQIDQCIRSYVENRASLSTKALKEAAEVAVDLLDSVCDRNKDTGRSRTRNQAERNLFTNLIGTAAEHSEDDFFVLQFLAELDPQAWSHRFKQLEKILEKLQKDQAPKAFTDTLKGIMQAYDSHHTDLSRHTAERPSPVGEPPARRRRLA